MGIDPKKVLEDVGKTGFPTELKVASMLRSHNWDVMQSAYFMDTDENKGREIDIISRWFQHKECDNKTIRVNVSLIIEVKKSQDKPWVVFTSPREYREVTGYMLLHRQNKVDETILRTDEIERHRPGRNLPRIGRTAYRAMTRSNDDSQVSAAVMSAVKAAIHARDAISLVRDDGAHEIEFFCPVVVLDGELFECYLDEYGEIVAESTRFLKYRQSYIFDDRSKGKSLTNLITKRSIERQFSVDFVTLRHFESYLDLHSRWINSMFSTIEHSVRK